jgi:hypothetical protein
MATFTFHCPSTRLIVEGWIGSRAVSGDREDYFFDLPSRFCSSSPRALPLTCWRRLANDVQCKTDQIRIAWAAGDRIGALRIAARFYDSSNDTQMFKRGITGAELERLSGALRFMELHCQQSRCGLWLLTTNRDALRSLIADIWKRITRLQGTYRLHRYSVTTFESRGGLHAHIAFIGTHDVARRLRASKQFGDVIDVRQIADHNNLARKYLAKERTPQAGYKRSHMLGGRIAGSHQLPGGGDRVRLSRELERDAIEAGYVEAWQHTNARRSLERKPYRLRGYCSPAEGQKPLAGAADARTRGASRRVSSPS